MLYNYTDDWDCLYDYTDGWDYFYITLVSCFHNWFHKYGTNLKIVTMNHGNSEILKLDGYYRMLLKAISTRFYT